LEGAVRTNAIIYDPELTNPGVVRDQIFHVSDFFPMLLRIAGARLDRNIKIDGIDQWKVVNYGGRPQRRESANIDDVFGLGYYINYPYKIVNGSMPNVRENDLVGSTDDLVNNDRNKYAQTVLASTTAQALASVRRKKLLTVERILNLRSKTKVKCTTSKIKASCDPSKAQCLFNIQTDPCEENNLTDALPDVMARMKSGYETLTKQVSPSIKKPIDPACDPFLHNFTWTWWQQDT
jgi:hypothetical protein